jgi:hypothetical protein
VAWDAGDQAEGGKSENIPRADLGLVEEGEGNVDDDRVDPPRRDVGEQPLQRRPIHRRAGEPAVAITLRQTHPAFVPLTGDEGLAGFALRLQRIEFLVEPVLGGFTGVDRTATLACLVPLRGDFVIGRPLRRPMYPVAWSGQRTAGPTNAPR